jgi:hypothetical protein
MRKYRNMKLIRPDNYLFFLRILYLLIVCFFISFSSKGQKYQDTSNVEVTDAIVDTTVIEETPNYFDKIYEQEPDTIELRHVPAHVIDSLKNDEAFWYANAKLKKKKEEPETNQAAPKWLKISVWTIVIGAFLAALIWYLVSSNILIFANRQKQIDSVKEENEIPEDIFSINYQKELDKAVTAENYRLAIRLMFLRLLKNLSNKNIIQYRQERTNFEYLSQLFSSGYYNDFFRLTRNYEYAWYGKFDVSQEAFRTIKNDFENFDRKLK